MRNDSEAKQMGKEQNGRLCGNRLKMLDYKLLINFVMCPDRLQQNCLVAFKLHELEHDP
jgi:hypothetical protein